MYVFYGASRAVGAAVHLGGSLVPSPVRIAPDAATAFELARAPIDRPRLLSRLLGRTARAERHDDFARAADDLLQMLARLDWESEGIREAVSGIDPDHPLSAVGEAIALIKADVDRLLDDNRRALEALRESEERYRVILDSIVDGFYEVDLEGNMVGCNDALLEVLGYSCNELIGRNNREYMDAENAALVFETFNRVWRTGEPERAFDWVLRRRDGVPVQVEASVSLIRTATGEPPGFRGIVRDVTTRIEAEADREKLERQLWQAQRMESLGRLAGGIAHNFNNLLVIAADAMPGGGGIHVSTVEVTHEALVDRPYEVILSSGYSRDGEAGEILARGCDDFLQKPYPMDELAAALDRLLQEGDAPA